MPITVGKVKNLFGDNNSYIKPNRAPTFDEALDLKLRPSIYSFLGGRTHLYGDDGNYAIYKGVYYFLKVDRCIDLEKKHYEYALIRDLWVNIIINKNVEVKGLLATTNRDSILIENLNRCYPILVQPSDVTRISLLDTDQSLSDIHIYEITKQLPINLFDIRNFQEFKTKWVKAAKKYKKQLELYKYRKGNSPIFIFGELGTKPVVSINSGKEFVKDKINHFLSEIKKNNDQIVISKVQSTEGAGRLKNHYCITWKDGGIGVGEENVVIDKIDLSSLEDIVSINPKTLEESAPGKTINEDIFSEMLSLSYESMEKGISGELQTKKFRSKIYFPFTQDPDKCGISLAHHYYQGGYEDNHLDESKVTWKGIAPQKVKTKGLDTKELFLFGVSNMDIVLNYNSQEGYKGMQTKYNLDTFCNAITDVREDCPLTKVPYPFLAVGGDYSKGNEADIFTFNNVITPLGFLIFQPFDSENLDGYIWKGNKTNKLHYISGLRKSSMRDIEIGKYFQKNRLNELHHRVQDYYWKENHSQEVETRGDRYYFNILNGLDILLQPNMKGYTYEFRTGRRHDRSSNNYSLRYLQYDQAPWLDNKSPFYSKDRHVESVRRSRKLIDQVVMKTLIELPTEISKGDYIFNDIEYWIDDYNTSHWTDKPSILTVGTPGGGQVPPTSYKEQFVDKIFRIEDYQEVPKEIDENYGNKIVICSTREGEIEVRELIVFSKTHKLHSDIYSANLAESTTDISDTEKGGSREAQLKALGYLTNDLLEDEQAIETVNGAALKKVTYAILKQINDPLAKIQNLEQAGVDEFSRKLLGILLKHSGHKVSPDLTSFLFYERKDFDMAQDLFFDLTGTEGYVHIKSGKVSLIAKNSALFSPKIGKIHKLQPNEKLKSMSVLEKINQKCVLNIYTQPRLLKSRFKFEEDKLDITVKAIKPVHKNNPTNYFVVNLRGDFDVIDREVIEIQKKQLDEQTSIVDYARLEELRTQMRRNDRDYEIHTARDVVFATEKMNESFRRREGNYSIEKSLGGTNRIARVITGASRLPVSRGEGLLPEDMEAVGQRARAYMDMGIEPPAVTLDGKSMLTPGKNHILGASQPLGMGVRLARGVINTGADYKILQEKGARIEKDKEFAFKDIAFKSLSVDLTHRDKQEDMIRRLNHMSNVYHKGVINDIDIVEEFNKENQLGNINLTVFTPTRQQLVSLEEIKHLYGVDCEIPDILFYVREGMEPEVVRFKHLELEHVTGIENRVEKEWMMGVLESGIRIVKGSDQVDKYIDRPRSEKEYYSCASTEKLVQELENVRISTGNTGETERNLRAQIDKLKAELDQKKLDIGDSKSDLERAHKQCEDIKFQLNEEIGKHKEDIQELTQKLNDERRLVLNKTDEINRLKLEKNNLEDQKSDIERQLRESLEAKNKVQKELEVCQGTSAPESIQQDCEFMKQLLKSDYNFTIDKRANGESLLTDLIIEIVESLKWMREGRVDTRVMKYTEMVEVIKKLSEFELIPIVDSISSIINSSFGETFKSNPVLRMRSREPAYVNMRNQWERAVRKQNLNIVYSIKGTLDELNGLTYKAKESLKDRIDEDVDLRFMFKHVYPGKAIGIYKTIFGDPNISIIRRKYIEEEQCPSYDKKDIVKHLKEYKEEVIHEVDSIDIPTPKHLPPGLPVVYGKALTDDPRYMLNAIGSFTNVRDGGKGWNRGERDEFGNSVDNIEFHQYPYWYDMTNGQARRVIWVYINSPSLGTKQDVYFDASRFTQENPIHIKTMDNIKNLVKKMDQMTIDPEFLKAVKENNKKFVMNLYKFEPVQSIVVVDTTPQENLSIFGDYVEDFIKLLFIFKNNKLVPSVIGQMSHDNGSVVDFIGYSSTNINNYKNLGKDAKTKTVVFDVGILAGDGSSVLNYFYKIIKGKSRGLSFFHPGRLQKFEATYKIFDKMYNIRIDHG